jgi:uncharacterized protein
MKHLAILFFAILCSHISSAQLGTNSITLTDIELDNSSPASMIELLIPSDGVMLQGLMYKANGGNMHPTLFLLHGYPGNERNLDIAQVVRASGCNVIYFNYRGSWGNQGDFSFENCVQDVVNAANYFIDNAKKFQVDTNNMVLFGHSMGGFVALKAIQQLPAVKKCFVLSTWDIFENYKNLNTKEEITAHAKSNEGNYTVLNKSAEEIFSPLLENPSFFDLAGDSKSLREKEIVMLDESEKNLLVADAIKNDNTAYFKYEIWKTDHSFTNKRVSLMNEVLMFINK